MILHLIELHRVFLRVPRVGGGDPSTNNALSREELCSPRRRG